MPTKKLVKAEERLLPEVSTNTPMPEVKPPKTEPKKSEVVKNVSRANHKVFGVFVKPGAIYEVTESDRKDKLGVARLENAIKQGKLERK